MYHTSNIGQVMTALAHVVDNHCLVIARLHCIEKPDALFLECSAHMPDLCVHYGCNDKRKA